MDPSLLCSICLRELAADSTTVVHEKGLQTLIKKSQDSGDDKWKQWIGKQNYTFHLNCRKRYAVLSSRRETQLVAEPNTMSLPVSSAIAPALQSVAVVIPSSPSASGSSTSFSEFQNDFQFDKLCFICGNVWDKRKPGSIVSENRIKDRLIAAAREHDDSFGAPIIARLQSIESIVASKARYHTACHKKLILPLYKKPSSPKIEETDVIFQRIYEHIESSGEFKFRLSTLQALMGDEEDHQISTPTLFRHLKKKFADDIFIFQHKGKESLIYYKYHNIAQICSDWYGGSESLGESAKRTILQISAEILQDEIKNFRYNTTTYPTPQAFLDTVASDIPPLLNNFLHKLMITDGKEQSNESSLYIKIENVAHCIISALRPKSFISCLQLSVGTYIYRKTGSKLAINLLNRLGVCSSYHNIQLHEASTIIHPQTTKIENAFVQYVFDNTDHNASTLDGRETFHCLGGIAAYTPADHITYEGSTMKCKKMPDITTLASKNIIPDTPYDSNCASGLAKIKYEDISSLKLEYRCKMSPTYATFLWGKCFKSNGLPMWRGFMETVSNTKDDYYVSHVKCLPFINRPPSQYQTLNTALHYAASESRKLQQVTFVTFDQPLYLKARDIVAQYEDNQLKKVVVRLGGFHLLMSYLGAVGCVMAESGLEDLWSVAYASESVKKMLSGHAFSRAIRAHILTFTSLGVIICRSIPEYEKYEEIIESFLAEWDENPPSLDDCESNSEIGKLSELFTQQLTHLSNCGPTAKLWIQYFKAVLVALEFIEAERLGNWKLHLHSIEKMLPIFHAAGHYPYAKCAQLYLQDMAGLETLMADNEEEYESFTTKGFFTIRRSYKAWAGVWSDMTIEQTLNRYFGTDLKHGRGVTPSVVARYLSTMPSAFNIMSNLENYCGVISSTSEQHVDLSPGRIQRDDTDGEKFVYWLNERKPFEPRDQLISLSTGVVGGPNIDCHLAFEKGKKGMEKMVSKTVDKISLTRAYKVQTLAVARKGMIVNHSDLATINPLLLFQRITKLLTNNSDLIRTALEYELSPYPLSLFDENGYMRKGTKSDLYDVFETTNASSTILKESVCVIDGGWLLHQIQWPHSKTFKDICDLYVTYVHRHYPEAYVVFDGYSNENFAVKTYERFRRHEKNFAPDINISMDLMVSLTREKFLANIANKQKFICLLAESLRQSNINVARANGDADKLIVTTAIELKNRVSKSVVVVGNDVDLIVLLVALTSPGTIIYFYKMGSGKTESRVYDTHGNQRLRDFILFAHAFSGCDSTSALFNKGKKKLVKLFLEDAQLTEMIQPFYRSHSEKQTLFEVAEKIIFQLYLNNNTKKKPTTIAELRYCSFNQSIFHSSKESSLASLPPTQAALLEHTKRVYYQVQEWLGENMDPEEWGWKKIFQSIMYPVMTTAPPAPDVLLEQVRCSCTDCSTSRCTCKKSGIRCTQLCKNCEGETCENKAIQPAEDAAKICNVEEDNDELEEESETEEQIEEELGCTEIAESMEIDFDNY